MKLSELIRILNNRFATDFTEADRLFFSQIEEELAQDQELKSSAQANKIENFKFKFNEQFMDKVIDRMDQNEDIFKKINDNQEFKKTVQEYMLKKTYHRLAKKTAQPKKA